MFAWSCERGIREDGRPGRWRADRCFTVFTLLRDDYDRFFRAQYAASLQCRRCLMDAPFVTGLAVYRTVRWSACCAMPGGRSMSRLGTDWTHISSACQLSLPASVHRIPSQPTVLSPAAAAAKSFLSNRSEKLRAKYRNRRSAQISRNRPCRTEMPDVSLYSTLS